MTANVRATPTDNFLPFGAKVLTRLDTRATFFGDEGLWFSVINNKRVWDAGF